MIKSINSKFLHLIVIAFLSGIMTLSFWIYGIPQNPDAEQHLQSAISVYESLKEGELFLKGEPNVNYGYGGIALRFYPPFTYYSFSLTRLITGDWYNAFGILMWIWFFIGGVGVYLLSSEWLTSKYSLLASIFYLVEPYRNAQIHLTAAFAEFIAGVCLTFCFYFITRIIKYKNTFDIIGLSISFALLILTHIPLTIIGSICLLIYSILSLKGNEWKQSLFKLSFAAIIGILASSFYWIKLVTELGWINLSSENYLTTGEFNYKLYFLDIRGKFFPGDIILILILILIVPSILALLYKSRYSVINSLIPLISITLFSIFMTTSYSQPIWEISGTLQKIQFPWRWLTIVSIGYAIILAAGCAHLRNITNNPKSLTTKLFICVCLITNSYFTYAYIISANLLDIDFCLHNRTTFQQMVEVKTDDKYLNFFLSIWSKPEAFNVKEKIVSNNRISTIERWDGFEKEFRISEGEPVSVRIATFYYPHWKATVNGENVNIEKDEYGAILVFIPQKQSIVKVYFQEPFIVNFFISISIIVSFCLLIIMLWLILLHIRNKFTFNNA